MPAISIEDAVNQSCQALLTGDLMRLIADFTPDALAAVMASAANIASVPALIGYSVQSHEAQGEEHVFRVAFTTSAGEVIANATWKDVEGFWKITSLTLEGL